MPVRPLLIVSLTVDPAAEAAFNDFYHHAYIPRLLEVVPEIVSARRYEEHGAAGSLRWFSRRFLTLYELGSEAALSGIAEALDRPGRDPEREEWARYKEAHLGSVERILYRPLHEHPRGLGHEPFEGRPFFQVSVEVQPEREDEFDRWYHDRYLVRNLADVPSWSACRRYKSVGRTPTRALTFYEAESLAGLSESLELMRGPHRLGENASWHDWDSGPDPVITWQDAGPYRCIFRYPG